MNSSVGIKAEASHSGELQTHGDLGGEYRHQRGGEGEV